MYGYSIKSLASKLLPLYSTHFLQAFRLAPDPFHRVLGDHSKPSPSIIPPNDIPDSSPHEQIVVSLPSSLT